MTDILLAGVGGQGTVLASKLLARAAMDTGLPVRTAETLGMAQRGGSVVSHVRIGESSSSLIPLGCADMIIGFEPAEAVRCLPYLKKGGTVVVNATGIMPVTASLGGCAYDPQQMIEYLRGCCDCHVVDGDSICEKCGSSKVLNVALLGAAVAAGSLSDISKQSLLGAISEMVPERFLELNKNAFSMGCN